MQIAVPQRSIIQIATIKMASVLVTLIIPTFAVKGDGGSGMDSVIDKSITDYTQTLSLPLPSQVGVRGINNHKKATRKGYNAATLKAKLKKLSTCLDAGIGRNLPREEFAKYKSVCNLDNFYFDDLEEAIPTSDDRGKEILRLWQSSDYNLSQISSQASIKRLFIEMFDKEDDIWSHLIVAPYIKRLLAGVIRVPDAINQELVNMVLSHNEQVFENKQISKEVQASEGKGLSSNNNPINTSYSSARASILTLIEAENAKDSNPHYLSKYRQIITSKPLDDKSTDLFNWITQQPKHLDARQATEALSEKSICNATPKLLLQLMRYLKTTYSTIDLHVKDRYEHVHSYYYLSKHLKLALSQPGRILAHLVHHYHGRNHKWQKITNHLQIWQEDYDLIREQNVYLMAEAIYYLDNTNEIDPKFGPALAAFLLHLSDNPQDISVFLQLKSMAILEHMMNVKNWTQQFVKGKVLNKACLLAIAEMLDNDFSTEIRTFNLNLRVNR